MIKQAIVSRAIPLLRSFARSIAVVASIDSPQAFACIGDSRVVSASAPGLAELTMDGIERITLATFAPPTTIELKFVDGQQFSLQAEAVGLPMDLINWPTLVASPDGEKVVVKRVKGDPVSIDAATFRCLVDSKYAARMAESFARFFEVDQAAASKGELARHFAELTARWKKDTRYSSLTNRIAEHQAYREIVAMGKAAIPMILADLEKKGGQWFAALQEITGANPVRSEDAGKISNMTAAWIAWGKAQGYQW